MTIKTSILNLNDKSKKAELSTKINIMSGRKSVA